MYAIGFMTVYMGILMNDISPSGINVREYAGAHSLVLLLLVVLFAAVIEIIRSCVGLYQKSRKAFSILQFGLFVFLVLFYVKADGSCDGWEKGLKYEIDNTGDYCHIEKPGVCWPVVFDNFLKFGPETCKVDQFQARKNK